jgi:hypothetical protein
MPSQPFVFTMLAADDEKKTNTPVLSDNKHGGDLDGKHSSVEKHKEQEKDDDHDDCVFHDMNEWIPPLPTIEELKRWTLILEQDMVIHS